jgi:hypothetical protein
MMGQLPVMSWEDKATVMSYKKPPCKKGINTFKLGGKVEIIVNWVNWNGRLRFTLDCEIGICARTLRKKGEV